MGHSTVMLRAAKHLTAHRDRPFAALRVTVEGLISSSVLFFETALFFLLFDVSDSALMVRPTGKGRRLKHSQHVPGRERGGGRDEKYPVLAQNYLLSALPRGCSVFSATISSNRPCAAWMPVPRPRRM